MASPTRDKRGTYYCRIGIPLELRPIIGRSELKRSLRTKDPAEAKLRFPTVHREFTRQLENARRQLQGDQPLAPRDFEILADRWLKETAEKIETDPERSYREWVHWADEGDGRYLDSHLLGQLSDAAESGEEAVAELVDNVIGKELHRFLSDQGTPLPHDSEEYHRLCLRIAAKGRKLLSHVEAVERDKAPAVRAPKADEPLSWESAQKNSGLTLSDGWKAYQEKIRRELEPRQAENRITEYRPAILDFIEYLGDKPMNAVSRDDVMRYRDLMYDLPSRPSRSVAELPVSKRADKAIADNLPRLAPRSIRKRMTQVSALFTQATDIPDSWVTTNPVQGIKLPPRNTVQAASAEKDYRSNELAQVFGSDWFDAKANASRKKRYGAAAFWLPILAYYTGARREELASLSVADVGNDGGIPIIAIRADAEDKSVKNVSSVRRVPIHRDLEALGFLDYVASLPKNGSLWPDLRAENGRPRGYGMARRFGEFMRSLGVRQDVQPMHGFRHTFATLMRRQGVDESIISRIDGHALQTQTSQYGSYPLDLLKETIDKLPTISRFEQLQRASSDWK